MANNQTTHDGSQHIIWTECPSLGVPGRWLKVAMDYSTPSAQKPTRLFHPDNVARCDGCGSAFHTAAGCEAISTAKARYAKKKVAYGKAVHKAKLAVEAIASAFHTLKVAQWHWQDDASTSWDKQGKAKLKNKFAFRFRLSLNRQAQAKLTALNFHAKFARRTRSVLPAPALVPIACRRLDTVDCCPPSFGRSATYDEDFSSSEAEESPLAVGTVFTGFECEVPKAPAGTAWYPHGQQGSYILEEQEIPPPEEVPPPDDEFRSLIHLLRIQKESSRLIAEWCVEKWKRVENIQRNRSE